MQSRCRYSNISSHTKQLLITFTCNSSISPQGRVLRLLNIYLDPLCTMFTQLQLLYPTTAFIHQVLQRVSKFHNRTIQCRHQDSAEAAQLRLPSPQWYAPRNPLHKFLYWQQYTVRIRLSNHSAEEEFMADIQEEVVWIAYPYTYHPPV